jgi:hypothetical protein
MTTIIVTMETILTIINPFFDKNTWQCYKKENTLSYRKREDEFIISLLPNTGEIKVSVPLREVIYYNKFYNIEKATEYIKMHLTQRGETPLTPH